MFGPPRTAERRYSELDETLINTLPANSEDRSGSDDLTHRIKAGVKTTLTDEMELATQRG